MIREFIKVDPLDVNLELRCREVLMADGASLVWFWMAGTRRRRRRRRSGFFRMIRLDVDLQKIAREPFVAVLARGPSPFIRRDILHGVIFESVRVPLLVTHVALEDVQGQEELVQV